MFRTHRPGAAEPPAPLRPPAECRARRRAGGQGGGGSVPVRPEPRHPPVASRSGTERAPAFPEKGPAPRTGTPDGTDRAEAGAGARPPRRGISAEARSPGHRPGRCLPRCPRPGGTGHGTSLGPGPSPGRGPTEGTGGTRTRSGAARGGGAGTEPSPTARQSTSSATKTFLRSIPQPVRPRGPAPRLTWPGTARARSGGKVRAGGAGRSRSRCPRPGPGRGGSGGDGAGVGPLWTQTPLAPRFFLEPRSGVRGSGPPDPPGAHPAWPLSLPSLRQGKRGDENERGHFGSCPSPTRLGPTARGEKQGDKKENSALKRMVALVGACAEQTCGRLGGEMGS